MMMEKRRCSPHDTKVDATVTLKTHIDEILDNPVLVAVGRIIMLKLKRRVVVLIMVMRMMWVKVKAGWLLL